MYHGWMGGTAGMGWTLMCVVMVLFWIGVITAIILAIRYVGGSSNTAAGAPTYRPSPPEDLLAERFARGQIDDTNTGGAPRCCTNTVNDG